MTSRRFVHLGFQHLAGLEVVITPENWSGPLEIRTALDGRVLNAGVARYQALNNKHLIGVESSGIEDDLIYLDMETSQSKLRIAEAARTQFTLGDSLLHLPRQLFQEPEYVGQECTVEMQEGHPLTIEKIVTLYTSRDRAISECGLAAKKTLANVERFEDLLRSHCGNDAILASKMEKALNPFFVFIFFIFFKRRPPIRSIWMWGFPREAFMVRPIEAIFFGTNSLFFLFSIFESPTLQNPSCCIVIGG